MMTNDDVTACFSSNTSKMTSLWGMMTSLYHFRYCYVGIVVLLAVMMTMTMTADAVGRVGDACVRRHRVDRLVRHLPAAVLANGLWKQYWRHAPTRRSTRRRERRKQKKIKRRRREEKWEEKVNRSIIEEHRIRKRGAEAEEHRVETGREKVQERKWIFKVTFAFFLLERSACCWSDGCDAFGGDDGEGGRRVHHTHRTRIPAGLCR